VGDWDFDDGFGPTEELEEKEIVIESRVVVLKHMFTLQELRDDPTVLLDLKEDVREEAEAVGDVTNVVLYDVSFRHMLIFTTHGLTGGARRNYDSKVP
jgi:HIV Tat-specific factor 1